MLGKTHLVVGTAVTMTVMQPQSFSELLIGLGTSVIGAVISDIDVGTSKSSKAANRIIAISLVTVAIVLLLECFGHIGVLKLLQKNSSLMRAVIGALCFIGVCIFGKMQPHRSFMHRCKGPEGFLDENCAEFCNIDDPEDLARAIKKMSERYGEIDTGYLQLRANEFSSESVADRAIGIYKKLIK